MQQTRRSSKENGRASKVKAGTVGQRARVWGTGGSGVETREREKGTNRRRKGRQGWRQGRKGGSTV